MGVHVLFIPACEQKRTMGVQVLLLILLTGEFSLIISTHKTKHSLKIRNNPFCGATTTMVDDIPARYVIPYKQTIGAFEGAGGWS